MFTRKKANPDRSRSGRRLVESVFAGIASISLLATGLAGAAYAAQGDSPQSDQPAATEDGTGQQSQVEQRAPEGHRGISEVGTPSRTPGAKMDTRALLVEENGLSVDIAVTGTAPVKVGDKLTFEATVDASNANISSGDQFTIQFPPELAASLASGQTSVPLIGQNGDGDTVTFADCAITGANQLVTCTFTDEIYKDKTNKVRWDEIHCGLKFSIEAVKSNPDPRKFEFKVNGDAVLVDIPGGGVISPKSPQVLKKSGDWLGGSSNTAIGWAIDVPGKMLADAVTSGVDPLYLTDTLPDGMKLCDGTPNFVGVVKNADFKIDPNTGWASAPTLVSGSQYRIDLTAPAGGFDPDKNYRVTYNTCTTDGKLAPKGTVYTNTANINIDGVSGVGAGKTQDWDTSQTTKAGAFLDGSRQSKLAWTVTVPGSAFGAGGNFDLVDTLSGNQKLCPAPDATLAGMKVYQQYGLGTRTDVTNDVVITTNSSSETGFDVTIAKKPGSSVNWHADDPNFMYAVTYTTCVTDDDGNIVYPGTPDANTKQTYSNSATAAGVKATGAATIERTAAKSGAVNLTSGRVVGGIERNSGSTVDWRIVIPGDKIPDEQTMATLTDTFGDGQSICTNSDLGASVKDRLNLQVHAVDQFYAIKDSTWPFGGDPTPAVIGGNVKLDNQDLTHLALATDMGTGQGFKLELPAPDLPGLDGTWSIGFSKEYKYVVTYTTCTTDGLSVKPGQQVMNSVDGLQVVSPQGGATNNQTVEGWGRGQTLPKGGFGVEKELANDSTAEGLVPTGTEFTVLAKLYNAAGKQVGDPVEMKVPLGGAFVPGPFARGNGYSVELTELTPPAIDGVEWGDYAFESGEGIELSDNGHTATFDLSSNSIVNIMLVNKADFKPGGKISVTKALIGDGAPAVPEDKTYEVTASFETPAGVDPIEPRTIIIKARETVDLTDLPVGTKVTFSEEKPEDGEGVAWSEPEISSPNPVIVPDVSEDQEPVLVTVTNEATLTLVPEIDLIKTKTDQGEDWEPKRGNDVDVVDPGTHPIAVEFTNTGTEPLKDLVFNDATSSGQTVQWDSSFQFKDATYPVELGKVIPGLVLQPGDRVVILGKVDVKFGEVHTNDARIDGVGVYSGKPVNAEDDTTYQPREPKPAIDLIKTKVDQGDKWEPKRGNDKDEVKEGTHPIIARFTNTGEEALKDLVFNDTTDAGQTVVWEKTATASDGKTYPVELGKPIAGLILEPGQSVVIKGTVKVEAGKSHTDTAKIDGVGAISGKSVTAKDDTTYTGKPAQLPKTGAVGIVEAGALGLALLGLGALLVRRQKRA